MNFKALKETVEQNRQASTDALLRTLADDKTVVLGTGKDAVAALDQFLQTSK